MKNEMSNGTRTLYRFTSLFASFSMVCENDEQALTYATEMTDGAETVKVERFSTNGGDWFVRYAGQWIYDAEASRVTNFRYNPALAI